MHTSNNDEPCLIALTDVSYRVGQVAILNDINFHLNERRIGIVGRNGSGKSTLARLLCGLMPPSTGVVRINDVDVANDRHNTIRTVGMLFQNPDHQIIFPTVEEELLFGLRQLGHSHSDSKKAVYKALEQFDCVAWADRSASTLSQGQRHLVCLMAILLMKPRLVVLDEPYAGLDIPTTMQLKRHLHQIDAAIVHISHQPDMLEDYDHILWIDNGLIKAAGTPADVLPEFNAQMQQLGRSNALV